MKKKITDPFSFAETLHVAVGFACNNNCIFCMESDRVDRYTRLTALTDEAVVAMLHAKKGLSHVVFTSGEPTLNRKLPGYVRLARELGYGDVSVVTNGRMFSYGEFAREMVEAGLTEAIVSLHGSSARAHDRLTRSPGSFAQSVAGLKNLCALKAGGSAFRLHVSRIVCRANIKGLAADLAFFSRFPLDSVIINPLMPQGRADNKRLLAKYSEIVAGLEAGIPKLGARVSVNDIPMCAGLSIRGNMGTMEQYHIVDDCAGGGYTQPVLEGRVKRGECARCMFDSRCIGVWENYVNYFGWDEFEPVENEGVKDE